MMPHAACRVWPFYCSFCNSKFILVFSAQLNIRSCSSQWFSCLFLLVSFTGFSYPLWCCCSGAREVVSSGSQVKPLRELLSQFLAFPFTSQFQALYNEGETALMSYTGCPGLCFTCVSDLRCFKFKFPLNCLLTMGRELRCLKLNILICRSQLILSLCRCVQDLRVAFN